MSRLLGFLIGIFLVIALVIALARCAVTEFTGDDRAQADAAAAPAESPQLRLLPRADEPPPASVTVDESGEAVAPRPRRSTPDAEREESDDAENPAGPAETKAEPAGDSAAAPPGTGGEAASDTRQWYAFWQPFHSEVSAAGFLARLQRVTGLDYRIVSPRPGEYQVAFAYRDEAERQAHLAAIEQATGLVLRSKVL